MDPILIKLAKRITSEQEVQGNLYTCFPRESTYYSVPNYLDRMDKVSLEIASNREPVDKTIVLWWGFDGLRVNQDGTMEWISRWKETSPNQEWIRGTNIKATKPIIQSFRGTPVIYKNKSACLMYAIEEIPGCRPEKGYTDIPGILTIPALNFESDLIEQTTLGDFGYRVYTKKFNKQLDFTVKLNETFFYVWSEFYNVHYQKAVSDGKEVWFTLVLPLEHQSIYFRGTPDLFLLDTVSATMEGKLSILMNGNIIKSERPDCIDVY